MSIPEIKFTFHLDHNDIIHAYCTNGTVAKKYLFTRSEIEGPRPTMDLSILVYKVAIARFKADLEAMK